jgi:hypothetical protein
MHMLYAAYDEACIVQAAEKANAPKCTEPGCAGSYTERYVCCCGNWFCNDCGDHIDSAIDKADGSICWAGAA